MMHIDRAGKAFYCPPKCNRKADDSGGEYPYKTVDSLIWSEDEILYGKVVKLQGFPGSKKVKLFRVVAGRRTEWVATNDFSQNSPVTVMDMCALRRQLERYRREVKQTLGIEKCQCRSGRAQRNHIACVTLAWNCLTKIARNMKSNIYALKNGMLSRYMKEELRNPSIRMAYV